MDWTEQRTTLCRIRSPTIGQTTGGAVIGLAFVFPLQGWPYSPLCSRPMCSLWCLLLLHSVNGDKPPLDRVFKLLLRLEPTGSVRSPASAACSSDAAALACALGALYIHAASFTCASHAFALAVGSIAFGSGTRRREATGYGTRSTYSCASTRGKIGGSAFLCKVNYSPGSDSATEALTRATIGSIGY